MLLCCLIVAFFNVSIRRALLPLWLLPCCRWGRAYLSTHCVTSLYLPVLANKSRVDVCVCLCVHVLDSMCKCVCVCVCVLEVVQWATDRDISQWRLPPPYSPLIPDKVFNLLAWPGPPSDPGDLCPEDVEGSGQPLPRQPQHDKIKSGLNPKSSAKCELMLQTDVIRLTRSTIYICMEWGWFTASLSRTFIGKYR